MNAKLIVVLILPALVSACAAELTLTPIPAPTIPSLVLTATAAPTAAPMPSATAAPTATKPVLSTRTATSTPTVLTRTKTSTPTAPTKAAVTPASAETIARGAKLFHVHLCDSCHSTAKPFPGGFDAPNLGNISTEAQRIIKLPGYQGKAKNAAEYIRESVLEPNVYIVPGENYLDTPGVSVMYQDFAKELQPSELDAIIAYLLSLNASNP